MSVKDCSLLACLVETLQLTAYSGKPKTSAMLSRERPSAH
jgi:hypothetical protein